MWSNMVRVASVGDMLVEEAAMQAVLEWTYPVASVGDMLVEENAREFILSRSLFQHFWY